MRPIESSDVVRGQYAAYRKESGVDPRSDVETYLALRAYVDNWRWSGVPFYLRAGKKLATTATHSIGAFVPYRVGLGVLILVLLATSVMSAT